MFTWSQIAKFTENLSCLYVLWFYKNFICEKVKVRIFWLIQTNLPFDICCVVHFCVTFFGKVFLITVPIKKRKTENIQIPSRPVRSSKGTNWISHHPRAPSLRLNHRVETRRKQLSFWKPQGAQVFIFGMQIEQICKLFKVILPNPETVPFTIVQFLKEIIRNVYMIK